MIFTQSAAREKIASLESRVAELEADAIAKDESIAAMQADLVTKDQAIAEQVSKIAELTESHEKISGELATANTALETATAELAAKEEAIVAAQESAGAQATEILASIGQEKPLEAAESPSSISHLETFNSLKGAEATAYFNKFQKEIAAEQKAMI